ncbi:MAG TPA: hypothetical protein VEH86_01020, partial [Candidatus Acidoferrum sp.]|nr:hypothetical protein [Candidatus Acidoferrum sp.]
SANTEHVETRRREAEFLQLLIMPSFNEFLGGRPMNERSVGADGKAGVMMGPVLRSEAVDMDMAETYLLDGSFLGTLGELRMLGQ